MSANSSTKDVNILGGSQHNEVTQAYLVEYSRRHIRKVVCEQLFVNELSLEKW